MKMFNKRRQGRRPIIMLLSVGIVMMVAAFLVACRTEPYPTPTPKVALPTLPPGVTATPSRLKQYTNPVAFDLLYPTDWTELIIRQGIIVFGTQAAVSLDNTSTEPSMLVYRQSPDLNLNLDEVMDRFLEIGPLASGFTQVDRHTKLMVDTRPTVITRVEREAGNDLDAATSIVMAIEADNTYRYVFVATAPEAEFELWRPTFDLMLSSVKINE